MSFTSNADYGKYQISLEKENLANHRHNYAPEWVNTSTNNTGVFGIKGEGKEINYGGGVETVGESTPFSIIQPSKGIYRWRRVS